MEKKGSSRFDCSLALIPNYFFFRKENSPFFS